MATHLNDREYEMVRRLVYEYSRIDLGEKRRDLVASRLTKRLKATGLQTYADYCSLLTSAAGGQELVHLIDAISTNHTFFFRERKHFEFLAENILPAFIQEHASLRATPLPFRVWSAGCSSGEEPYSVAIALDTFFKDHPGWDWHIEATDISSRMLDRAMHGIYAEERLREVSPALLAAYFQKGIGSRTGDFRIKEPLRRRVTFRHQSLLQAAVPFTEPFHLIWCRNVMIYFNRETQEQLMARMYQLLRPGGHLFIGHSESLTSLQHRFRSVRPALYRKE